jgi:two-component sensor histidine kinase
MEQLLKFLPTRPQAWWVRYGVTALIVAAVFLVRAGSGGLTGPYGFALFVIPILAASIVFDRGSGFFATGLALTLVGTLLDWSAGVLPHAPALVTFLFVGMVLAFTGESLRNVAEHAVESERSKDLLYRELSHRIKNTFATVQAVLRLQARAQSSDLVREALEAASGRCSAIFQAHDHLAIQGDTVEMRAYLNTLGASLADGHRDVRPIAITVDAEPAMLPSSKAEPIGLIVNELVTNAFKYAFPENVPGTVHIKFFQTGGQWRLEVIDNGIGCPAEVKSGLGTTIMKLLAQQLDGRLTREDGKPGCRVILEFAISGG